MDKRSNTLSEQSPQLIKISDGKYEYRGWKIYRNYERYAKSSAWATRAPTGYVGILNEFAGPSLDAVKEDIDWLMNRPNG